VLRAARGSLKVQCALTITDEQVEEGLAIIRASVRDVLGNTSEELAADEVPPADGGGELIRDGAGKKQSPSSGLLTTKFRLEPFQYKL